MEATAATTLIAVCCCCRCYCAVCCFCYCCCCCRCRCLFVVVATVDICVGANVANFCLPFAYHKTRIWPLLLLLLLFLLLLLLQFYVLLAMIIVILLTMLMFNFGQLAYKFSATWPHVSTAAAANCSRLGPVYQLSHGLNTALACIPLLC